MSSVEVVANFAVLVFIFFYVLILARRRVRRSFFWKLVRGRKQRDYVVSSVGEDNKPIYEHRLIAERILGRKLLTGEVVHHMNGRREDNRINNLCVMSHDAHESYHAWYDWVIETYGKPPRKVTQERKLREYFRVTLLSDVR